MGGGSGMGKDDGSAAKLPASAFNVESPDIENGLPNGQVPSSGAEVRKEKAEHLAIMVSNVPETQLMEPVPQEKQLTLVFPHISAWVPDLFGPGSAGMDANIVTRSFQKLARGRSTQPNDGRPKERQVNYVKAYH